tara:strand:+ start:1587 stop:1787 length:201 start_codon:yes stop_codon:yes gene_type:complete
LLSKLYLIKQGKCCGHGCFQCPYDPPHSGMTNKININIYKNLEEWELNELKNEGINCSLNNTNIDN